MHNKAMQSDSATPIDEIVRKAVDRGKIPRYLYKYRKTEQTKKILESNQFWFANSLSFNDPFDSNLSVDPKFRMSDLRKYITELGFNKNLTDSWFKKVKKNPDIFNQFCLLYTSPSPRDRG